MDTLETFFFVIVIIIGAVIIVGGIIFFYYYLKEKANNNRDDNQLTEQEIAYINQYDTNEAIIRSGNDIINPNETEQEQVDRIARQIYRS